MGRVPVHIVGGFLGAGKTTALQHTLAVRSAPPHGERCAVLVNDVGEAQIDRALLGGAVQVSDIAGGCICCTAPAGLVPALTAILEEIRPDRLFIEPSGLARPQDILDMLARSGLRDRVALQPVLVLLDPARLAALQAHPLCQEQIEAADILLLSRCDLADPADLAAAEAWIVALDPAPLLHLRLAQAPLPDAALSWPEGAGLRLSAPRHHDRPSTDGFAARSWALPPSLRLSWDRLRDLLAGTEGLERFKGLLHTDGGWCRVDWAGGRLHMAATARRSDSRADLILRAGDPGGDAAGDAAGGAARAVSARLDAFGDALAACAVAEDVPAGPVLTLVDADGFSLALSREALRALPAQIADVGALVPGRAGEAVPLREILALAPPAARYIVTALDGMATAPAPVEGIGGAVLCHSLRGGPLPDDQGGPFRLLVPKGAPEGGASNCANVKGVARIRLL